MADPVNILSLYSGSGLHDEAVQAGLRVLGYESRILGYVEREASAAAWLLGRMEAQALEPAPVFCGDLADLDARPMRGHVDIVVASPPCQPYSSAGKRAGNADERSHGDGDGPLPHTIRIIDECRPALVWFENVSEWVTGGHFRGFGDELSRVGYSIQSPIFLAAEDVGAPHQRERVFILCVGNSSFKSRFIISDQQQRSTRARLSGDANRSLPELADGDDSRPRPGIEGIKGRAGIGRDRPANGGGELAECPSRGCGVRGQPSGGDRFAERSGEELGNARSQSGERHAGAIHRAETQGDRERIIDGVGAERPEPTGAELCNAGGARREGAELGGAPRDARATARRSIAQSGRDIPMFPPARNDYRRWAELVAGGLDPALMPCAERGLQHVVDGTPFSRADVLRLSGNSIVPLAAACAFVHAMRRLGSNRN